MLKSKLKQKKACLAKENEKAKINNQLNDLSNLSRKPIDITSDVIVMVEN